ncbi:MarR family winged helix-turn-helix transcriptional regulator [Brasilonema bromeliae]|uniref:MarR family transcriptional regulator n=1 Tax=Brasilonema bromeliae SPC951 TaxID=385972 RepID=A0ABX1PEY0_9CYAN|nr:MarR family transcriptional regulator [Brasilonema bromeliae]NMG22141.1 MarR family transcriptional regulator [Brasilonema bromeliae SPC951]
MLPYDFDASIGFWICMANQAVQRELADRLEPQGITYRQAQVLGNLIHSGEMTQATLARKMFIEPPTLVGILNRMERDGWIGRTICPSDRRKKYVRINPEAADAWSKVVECAYAVRAKASDGLTDEELATLKRLLEKVRANLGAGVEIADLAACDD